MSAPVYRFRLSDVEYAQAWLTGLLARPGARLRLLLGPLVAALGAGGIRRAADSASEMVAALALAWGLWLLLRPLGALAMQIAARRRSGAAAREIAVSVERDGIRVCDGRREHLTAWSEVASVGARPSHVWWTTRRGARAAIPSRVIADPAALVTAIEEKIATTRQ